MLHEGNIVTIDESDMTEQDYLTSVQDDSPEHVMGDSLDEMNEILHDYFDRTSTRFAVTVSKGIKNSGITPYWRDYIGVICKNFCHFCLEKYFCRRSFHGSKQHEAFCKPTRHQGYEGFKGVCFAYLVT